MTPDDFYKWAPWIAVACVAVIVLLVIVTSGGSPDDCIRHNGDWYCR